MATVRAYREQMAAFSGMRLLDIWYAQTTADDIETEMMAMGRKLGLMGGAKDARQRLNTIFSKARVQGPAQGHGLADRGRRWAVAHRGRSADGLRTSTSLEERTASRKTFSDYRATLAENRRELVERYRFVDVALKVVGVGSVGTRCFVVLLEGRDQGDPLLLQAKEATASVLDPYVTSSLHANHGERVVVGQRLMQATPDIFLGWTRGPGGRDFYFRQLWDMKGSVDTTTLRAPGMGFYGGLCARSLARAHARSGDAVAIAAYLGTSDTFDGAVADFSEAYADQNERDHAAFVAAISAGTITAVAG